MREIILITISGQDKPGVTQTISEILSRYNIHILDIGQAVIHNTLSLGFLVEVPIESESSPVLRDVLFRLYEMDLSVKFRPITETEYEEWVSEQGKQRHIVTILGKYIKAEHLAKVSQIIVAQKLNIDKISRLTGRVSLDVLKNPTQACIEFSVRGTPENAEEMREHFLQLAHTSDIDIAVQRDDIYRRNRRLVVFDMDSTLIQVEVIDELAKAAGVGERVIAITEEAMRGNLDFKESFARRLSLLEGLEQSKVDEIARKLPLTEGAERLLSTLKKLGYKTAILSGGFTYFARILQQRLGIDYVFANELEIVDGKVTGIVRGEVVDADKKAEYVSYLAEKESIKLQQVVAIGDGANDLKMLSKAGLGIAFRAKPIVREAAKQSLSSAGLDGILYLMGIKDREIQES